MTDLTDHNALIGPYPFRRLPEPTPERLLAEMDRLGIAAAWVGHVPSIFYRDVAAGNDELFAALEPHRARLLPVPAVNPAYPGWERELRRARAAALASKVAAQWCHCASSICSGLIGASHST